MKNSCDMLLVEDNPNDAELIMRALVREKISDRIVHLEDGAEIIDYLLGRDKYKDRDTTMQPKVIILDLKLPKMTGLEVLEVLRENETTELIPIVIVTSSMEDCDVERAYSLGVNSFIVKPVDFNKFIKSIKMVGDYWLNTNHQPY